MTARHIPDPPTHPEFADAIHHWTPVISPSGMTFYTADAIPGWKGNLLIGGLSSQAIVRLTLDGEKVIGEERIPLGARIRDVAARSRRRRLRADRRGQRQDPEAYAAR